MVLSTITLRQRFFGKGPRALARVSFISSLAISAFTTIWALYVNSFFNDAGKTSIFSGILTFVSIIAYFAFVPLVERSDKKKLFGLSVVLFILSCVLFALNTNFYLFIGLAFFVTIVFTLRVSTFGIIFEENSKKKELSRDEGLVYTFLNLGWVIGPLGAGYLANNYGYSLIFWIAAGISLVGLFAFFMGKLKEEGKSREITPVIRNFIDFFKSKDRVVAYLVGGGITSYWVLIYLFMPLHMSSLKLGTDMVGYFLFAVAVPLIILEYFFGRMVERIGYRKMFLTGTALVTLLTGACFFVSNIYAIAGILVFGSVGMAMLEPTTEAYFLRITKKKDASKYYGPFNTSRDLSQMAAKLIPSLFIALVPFKFLFLFFAGFMALIFFFSFFVRKV